TRSSASSAQHLSCLFKTAIKSRQQEILNWYYYSLEFEKKVHAITADGKIKDKTARTMVYKEMRPFLPNITQDNLRKKTLRARKLLILFGKNGVGIDKIKRITYSANEISKLTNAQIQNIINQEPSQAFADSEKVPETEVSVSSNSTHDRAYFHNKILEQYPNLYQEFSSENVDYYGITDETLCPLCELNHEDEEG
ncbi:12611_t:CDS:2, partial [Entrophospora sp. SA101]